MKRWLAIIPLLALGALVVVSISRLTSDAPAPGTFSSPERPTPQIELAGLDGPGFSPQALKGQVYIVNFWASWCTPCLAEHPILMDMAQQGAPIVGVVYKDKDEPARAWLAGKGNPYRQVATDTNGDAGLAFGIAGVPESFLVNADGKIVRTVRGPMDPANAKAFLDAWRKLAPAPANP